MSSKRSSANPAQTGEGSSARQSWEGDPPQVAAARQRLLEAAARCIGRDGIAASSMAAIAAEAGVSRQTVYRYFQGRDELVLRAIRAASEGVRTKIAQHIRALADPADMIVETLVLGLSELQNDPVLSAISDLSRLDGSVLARITGRAGIEWTRETLAPAIEAANWSEAEADPRLELILRVFLSLIVSPSPERSPEELRAFLYRHVVPGLALAAAEGT